MLVVTLVVAAVVVTATAHESTVQVTLKQGAILGSREEATNGRVYYSFKTIPYAKPPVGALRLKDPEPALGWSGVRDGSLPLPRCPQTSIFQMMKDKSVKGQEDCLYLNVYTPKPYRSNLPVMVYIHGGAFVAGSALGGAAQLLPSPILQKDVVVVALNYRLGALGFLSTGDSVLPGNMGLKDQVLALRWVQDNIKDLGGDPQQVTIFGVSAGGISSHLHILSPASAGLFQRAILQSGTALMPNVFSSGNKGAIAISKALNCTGEESHQLLKCFMKASMEDLITAQSKPCEWYDLPMMTGIQVDGTFLPDSPAALLRSGRFNKEVDVIIGWTKDEGNLITSGLFSKKGDEALQELNDNFQKVGPILLMFMDEENPVHLAHRVYLHYMGDNNLTLDTEPSFTALLRDYAYEAPGVQSAEFHVKNPHAKTFTYRLDHCLKNALFSVLANSYIKRKMAGHGDDTLYLFQATPPPVPVDSLQDSHLRDIMVNLWTNFATTGNPTLNGTLGFRWPPLTPKDPHRFLSLTGSPRVQPVNRAMRDFWNSLPTKATKLLYPESFLPEMDTSDTVLAAPPSCVSVLSAPDSCSSSGREARLVQ